MAEVSARKEAESIIQLALLEKECLTNSVTTEAAARIHAEILLEKAEENDKLAREHAKVALNVEVEARLLAERRVEQVEGVLENVERGRGAAVPFSYSSVETGDTCHTFVKRSVSEASTSVTMEGVQGKGVWNTFVDTVVEWYNTFVHWLSINVLRRPKPNTPDTIPLLP